MSKVFGIIVCDSQAKWGGPEGIAQRMRDLLAENGEQWKTFIAERGEFPSEDELKSFQGIYIPGSKHSVNDESQPWIQKLLSFIQQCYRLNKPKVFGTCFGHQALAKALGGNVALNPSKKFICCNEKITINADEADSSDFVNHLQNISETKCFRLLESHGECVEELPKGAKSVAYSESCKHEIVLYSENIIGVQPHPDFINDDLLDVVLPSALKRNAISNEEYENAKKSLMLPNVASDVIKAMRDFLKS